MIRACIFDLGGTIVDKYSLTPFLSLKKAFFRRYNLNIHNDLIFKDMGMDKKEHIFTILNNENTHKKFVKEIGRNPNEKDVSILFNDFNLVQLKEAKNINIIPETKHVLKKLKENNIKIGVNTGFNKEITETILDVLSENNIHIDAYVSSSCLSSPGRPHPYMIEYLMDQFSIYNPKNIIKIDDTKIGIQEGKNANCITAGVARWSTYMNVHDEYELETLTPEEIFQKMKSSKKTLESVYPNYIMNTLNDLPMIINHVNNDY